MDEKQQPIPNSETESVPNSVSELVPQMDLTWKCILEQHQQRAVENSREFGSGVSCFILKTLDGEFNCTYCYAARNSEAEGPWKSLVLASPNRKTFLSKYDPDENYAICVAIPRSKGFVVGIKLFKFDTGEEIVLPDQDPPTEDSDERQSEN